MPIKITELDDGLGNLIKGEGTLNGEEFLSAIIEHASKPKEQLKKYIYSISDYTDVTDVDINFEYLYTSSLKMHTIAKVNPAAIVVIAAPNSTVYNLAKIWSFAVTIKGWKIKVFKDRVSLDYWIDNKLNTKDSIVKLKFDH